MTQQGGLLPPRLADVTDPAQRANWIWLAKTLNPANDDGSTTFTNVTVSGTLTGSTVIGSSFETAASGQRVFIGTVSGQGQVDFYSGSGSETHPGAVRAYIDGTGNPQVAVNGPTVGSQASASIFLRAADAFSPFTAPMKSVQVDADQFVIGSYDLIGPWFQINPALSGSWAVGSTGEKWVRYRKIGKAVEARGKVFFNGTGCVFDTGISLEVQKPVVANSLDAFQCGSWVGQLGGASYCGIVKIHPTDELGNIQFLLPNGNNLGATNPATMIPTDYVHFSITYEAA